MLFPLSSDTLSHCSAASRCGEGYSGQQKVTIALSLSVQLPVPGGAAVVPGEVREGDFAVGAGGLRGVDQQCAPPPPAVLLPRGQRGWCSHRSEGAHQVRAAGARECRVSVSSPSTWGLLWGCEAGNAVPTDLVSQAGGRSGCMHQLGGSTVPSPGCQPGKPAQSEH